MAWPLTIVMFHYVRPLATSAYPRIKGLDLELFAGQLDYLERHYNPVTMESVVDALRAGQGLPERSVLLTFDDGYADHYHYVLPTLLSRGWKAAFFPPTRAVVERQMLDVNRVHFILASSAIDELEAALEAEIEAARGTWTLPSLEELRHAWRVASRFDPAEVIYVKRLLQHVLPESLRNDITSRLFRRFVSADETSFADDLYVSTAQLRTMIDAGMHVGSHGHAHYWLDRLQADEQEADIRASLELLRALGLPRRDFTFCYPYGAHDQSTVEILTRLGCVAAVTTAVDLAQLSPANALLLPRLDTNDLPKQGNAELAEWTRQASTAFEPRNGESS